MTVAPVAVLRGPRPRFRRPVPDAVAVLVTCVVPLVVVRNTVAAA